MSTPSEILFVAYSVCSCNHAPSGCGETTNFRGRPICKISLSVKDSEQYHWFSLIGTTEAWSVIGSPLHSLKKGKNANAAVVLIVLHYVNIWKATARIGHFDWNAGFHGKYREADWFFHWVTRNPQESGASPPASLHDAFLPSRNTRGRHLRELKTCCLLNTLGKKTLKTRY